MDELGHERKAPASQDVPVRVQTDAASIDADKRASRNMSLRPPPASQQAADKSRKSPPRTLLPYEEQPEELLATQAEQGNKEAFDVLAKKYESAIQRYIRRASSLEDDNSIADIMQETLLKAWQSLPMHDPKRTMNFRPWFYRVAYTTTIDYLRRNRLEYLLVPIEERGQKAAKQSSWVQQVEDSLCQRESLAAAFNQVYPKYRKCLTLRYIEELTFKEIAEELNINESTARAYISYGRKQFAQAYLREMNNNGGNNTLGEEKK